MKKRYQATVYIIQKNVDDLRVYNQESFRFKWCAYLFLFFTLSDTEHLVATGLITFKAEITEI
jgi:hypothetical protein